MTGGLVFDAAAGLLLVAGTFWVLAAAIGIVRFPSVLTRLHAASKPQVIGLLMTLVAVGLAVRRWEIVPFLALVWALQLVTVPITAHIVARTAHRTANGRTRDLVRDELEDDLAAASEGEGPEGEPAEPGSGAEDAAREGGQPPEGGTAAEDGPVPRHARPETVEGELEAEAEAEQESEQGSGEPPL